MHDCPLLREKAVLVVRQIWSRTIDVVRYQIKKGISSGNVKGNIVEDYFSKFPYQNIFVNDLIRSISLDQLDTSIVLEGGEEDGSDAGAGAALASAGNMDESPDRGLEESPDN